MQAFHIDPIARTVSLVDFPAMTSDVAALFNTHPCNVGTFALQQSDNPTDVIVVSNHVTKGQMGFFILPGVRAPVHGDAYIVGVKDARPFEADEEMRESDPAAAPSMSLDWVRDNIIWLKPAPQHSRGDALAFEAVDVSPGAILNMLRQLSEAQERGEIALTAEKIDLNNFSGGRIKVDSRPGTENDPNALASIVKSVQSKLH